MNSIKDKLLIVFIIVIISLWVMMGPSLIQGSGGFSSGVWTGYEKERIIRLLEEIAENTRSYE